MDYEAVVRRIREIEGQLSLLPPGNVVYKTIKGNKQPYLQWGENGKSHGNMLNNTYLALSLAWFEQFS